MPRAGGPLRLVDAPPGRRSPAARRPRPTPHPVLRLAPTSAPALALLLAAALGLPACWAQDAAEARRGLQGLPRPAELAPVERPRTDGELLPDPGASPRAQPVDEALELDVSAYELDPSTPAAVRALLEPVLARLTARYIGPRRRWEDLAQAADEVARWLVRERGYYLPHVYLPQQTPSGGRVRLAVLEGRLDRVRLQWPAATEPQPPVDRAVVERYLQALVPGEVLMERTVERVVFLLNDLRGLTARVDIEPGRAPGTATLVVSPRAEPRHALRADADVNGSRFLGQGRIGGLWTWASPMGRGDGLNLTALASHTGGLLFALAGYTVPVGADGWKVGGSLSALRYRLDRDAFPLGVQGTAWSSSGYLLVPAVRARNLNVFGLLTLEAKRNTDQINIQLPGERKRIDLLSLGVSGDLRDGLASGGVNAYDASFSTGRVALPDRSAADSDVAPRFRRLNGSVTRLQNLVAQRLLLALSLRGQLALDNLDTGEQFRLGGPDALRALAPGEGSGDSGWLAGAELRLLPSTEWFGRSARDLVLSAFFDAGQVRLRHTPAISSDPADNQLYYAGAGVGLSWSRDGGSARLTLARLLAGAPKADTRANDLRLYAQASLQF